jgi:predicted permease
MLAIRIYRALLLAYPAEFRHEYGGEMERLFADRLRSESAAGLWLEILADVAIHAPREHFQVLAADVRHGARILAKAPAFTFVALLAMALGIGATTAVFSLINAVLIRSLPYGDAERLVYIWTPLPRFPDIPEEMGPSAPDFYEWQRMSRSFADLTMFQQHMINVVSPESIRRVSSASVAGNFFSALRVAPEIGRAIEARDDQPGHGQVAVISHQMWRTQFSGDANVLGKTIQLNRDRYQVIGVMPPAFLYPHGYDYPYGSSAAATDVWIPAALDAKQKTERTGEVDCVVIGRLRPGVRLKQAQAEMSAIEARLDPLYPPDWRGWKALVKDFTDTAVGGVRPLLWMLLGSVSLVLLIACANVANLLMAKAAERAHEMGVRTALGAERGRLIRQMLTEALMLAMGGGTLGALLAFAAVRLVVRLNPGNIPRLEQTSVDVRVLLFTLGASLLTGLLFGVLPALAASRVDLTGMLKSGGNRGVVGSPHRLRNGLIVAEVALSVILLAGAGLLIRSYVKVQSVDTGYSASTLTMSVPLDSRYAKPEQTQAFLRTLLEQVSNIQGVESAGLTSALPLSHRESMSTLEVQGRTPNKGQLVDSRQVTTQYFEAMGIRLLAGRFFEDRAQPNLPPDLVVSQAFAKLYFRDEDPVGKMIYLGIEDNGRMWSRIVGLVSDVRHSSLETAPRPTVYESFWEGANSVAYLAARTSLGEAQLQASVREIVRRMDPAIAVVDFRAMSERVSETTSRRRFQTIVLSLFAGVALFLALVGLYGLLAFLVRQRTTEIGIRVALGASRAQVLAMVVRQGLGLTALGLALGIGGALALARLLAAWLYGVPPTDAVTFVTAPVFIFMIAGAACWIPAWRAARIDPMLALRHE